MKKNRSESKKSQEQAGKGASKSQWQTLKDQIDDIAVAIGLQDETIAKLEQQIASSESPQDSERSETGNSLKAQTDDDIIRLQVDKLFAEYDGSGTGQMDMDALESALIIIVGKEIDKQELEIVFREVDTDHDEKISTEELTSYIQNRKKCLASQRHKGSLVEELMQPCGDGSFRRTKRTGCVLATYLHFAEQSFRITNSGWFQFTITSLILATAILCGVATYPGFDDTENVVMAILQDVILAAFIMEAVLKLCSQGRYPLQYFRSGWNMFDLAVIIVCVLPFGTTSWLRALRLARLFKLLKAIPQLAVILGGLAGGLESIGYITLLILLVYYVFAVTGVQLYRANAPWHFGSMRMAMVTLFRCSTFEDWTDVMYTSVYGCDQYPDGSGPLLDYEGHSVSCTTPQSSHIVGPIYFVTFSILSGMVMLSLFIGVVTSAMANEADQMPDGFSMTAAWRDLEDDERDQLVSAERDWERKARLQIVWDSRHVLQVISSIYGTSSDASSPMRAFKTISVLAWWITESAMFQTIITAVILGGSVVIGLEVDGHAMPPFLEAVLVFIFTCELLLKILSFNTHPLSYLKTSWNVFDLIVVVSCYIPGGQNYAVLRLLRVLRILKLMKMVGRLRVILEALLVGMASIGFIGLLLVMVYYVFGLVGVQMFSSNDPWHFGSLHVAMLTLFRCSTFEDWTDVMYINMYGCDKYGYDNWAHLCTSPSGNQGATVVYFLCFIMISALVVLNLFIGVITTSMDDATEQQAMRTKEDSKLRRLQLRLGIPPAHIRKYVTAFQVFDLDGDGHLTVDDVVEALRLVGVEADDEKIIKIFADMDKDQNMQVSKLEWVEFLGLQYHQIEEETRREGRTTRMGVKEADIKAHLTLSMN